MFLNIRLYAEKDNVYFISELICERLGIPLVEIIHVAHLSSELSSKNHLLRVKCDLKQQQCMVVSEC